MGGSTRTHGEAVEGCGGSRGLAVVGGRERESWEGSGGLAAGVHGEGERKLSGGQLVWGGRARVERVAVGVGRECESWERSGGLAAGVGS